MKENRVRTILVSQPKPESDKSPYFSLAKRCNVKIDFRPFIHVEGLTAKEFRQQKISILSHDAVIFTSKNSMDHFFRMCEATRITVPEEIEIEACKLPHNQILPRPVIDLSSPEGDDNLDFEFK